jgi:hypothetical protein
MRHLRAVLCEHHVVQPEPTHHRRAAHHHPVVELEVSPRGGRVDDLKLFTVAGVADPVV